MSNTSNNTYVATYRYSVPTDWGKQRDEYGAVIVDFTDATGSGPLGTIEKVSDKLSEELKLDDLEVLTYVLLHGLVNWNDQLVIVGDQGVNIDDLKLVVIDTTAL